MNLQGRIRNVAAQPIFQLLTIPLLSVGLMLSSSAFGENITLTSGECVVGTIIEEHADGIVVRIAGRMPNCVSNPHGPVVVASSAEQPVRFTAKEVLSVHGRSLPTTPDWVEVPSVQSPFGALLPLPSQAGNAADEYVRAIQSVSARLEALGVRTQKDYKKGLPLTSQEIQWIVEGRKKTDSAFAPRYYPISLSGQDLEPDIAAIRAIANGLLEQGQALEVQGKDEGAIQLYASLVVFGWHLKHEQRSLVQHLLGIATESLGCEALQRIYAKQGLADRAAAYEAYRSKEQARLKLVVQKQHLMQADKGFASRVLQRDEEPMWRREAVQLVVIHMDPITRDSLPLLEQVAHQDPDESVRAAVAFWLKDIK